MIYAYVNWTWELVHHTPKTRGLFEVFISPDETVTGFLEHIPIRWVFFVHGWFLWLAWGVIGFG
jgi:hypothetical protein